MFSFICSETVAMRDKERVHDYRFMAEPNLPPLRVYTTATLPVGVPSDQIVNIDVLKKELPELPDAKRERLQRVHHLSLTLSSILVVSL
jgi:aspartyl-tRNA(Asn)/glutamyl-tRNA(Gln) amidotransferase subunit B